MCCIDRCYFICFIYLVGTISLHQHHFLEIFIQFDVQLLMGRISLILMNAIRTGVEYMGFTVEGANTLHLI